MVRENKITAVAFATSLVFYSLKHNLDPLISDHIFELSTYFLIISAALTILASINHLKLLYEPILGLLAFSAVNLGILLAATHGLGSSSYEVVEGLSRIILATFAIWKLSSDMRNLSLEIDPYPKERKKISSMLYGIVFPPKELFRLIKVILYIILSFYLIFSGLELLGSTAVDLIFFKQTEKLSLNILFFGIQTPMMMASRASISKTFSEYLKNLEWAQTMTSDLGSLNAGYSKVLNSSEISYDSISSNGKHLWVTILLMLILQAYQESILALDLFNFDYLGVLSNFIQNIRNFFSQLF